MAEIDYIQLNFSTASLMVLNIILGIVMFGVALDMKFSDFRRLLELPKSAMIGLTAQFLLLPAATFLLVSIVQPYPSIALGMLLVASCPGGNISNFFAYLARGNAALSVSLSAISTAFAIVMTPLNFAFWGSQYQPAQQLLQSVAIHPLDMLTTIFLLLGLPMALGLLISHRYPAVANRFKKPMKYFSMAFFLVFVLGALAANFDYFLQYVGIVALVVFLHNALALSIGYLGARAAKLPEADRRAVAIEVGIQNSGLGLILIFDFFSGLGGMAIVTAWWGIWHIISGMSLALFWSKNPPALTEPASA